MYKTSVSFLLTFSLETGGVVNAPTCPSRACRLVRLALSFTPFVMVQCDRVFMCKQWEPSVHTTCICFGLWSLVPTANSASALRSLLCRHFSLSKRVVVLFLIYNQNANFCKHSSCPLIAKLNRIYRSQLASPHTNKVFAHFGLPYLPNSRVPRVDMSGSVLIQCL